MILRYIRWTQYRTEHSRMCDFAQDDKTDTKLYRLYKLFLYTIRISNNKDLVNRLNEQIIDILRYNLIFLEESNISVKN